MKCRQVTVKIKTENAVFTDYCRMEVARILRVAAYKLENDVEEPPITLMDINGNRVGELTAR